MVLLKLMDANTTATSISSRHNLQSLQSIGLTTLPRKKFLLHSILNVHCTFNYIFSGQSSRADIQIFLLNSLFHSKLDGLQWTWGLTAIQAHKTRAKIDMFCKTCSVLY